MKRLSCVLSLCLVCLLAAGMTGCSSWSGGDERGAMVLSDLRCVAVLPTAVPVFSDGTVTAEKGKSIQDSGAYLAPDFGGDQGQHQLVTTSQPNVSSSGTLTAEKKQSLHDGAAYIDSVLVEELGGRPQYQLLTESQLDAILSDPWGGRLQQVRDIGRATGCGGVMKTTLSRYRQRVGGNMSVDTAASAAFSMELIGVESGVVVWTTSFDETQQPLSENIFSFKKAQNRGFKWLSVEELTRGGVKNRLEEFPYFQEKDGE
ncbi:MAG: hypothetical protein K9K37_05390 [Desulfocapsa sp.]|nr:hypothetical protein [Desulfocapsa sp.]